jgi:hypothetical protein
MSRKIGSKNKQHKEKPTKEKKQRGRPKGSIKQKQHQHQQQIVNVNINSSGGGGEKKKKKKLKDVAQNMIPNIIFNPSISIPQGAPINRPETNPPYYDINSLLQPIQQPTPPTRTPPAQVVQQVQPTPTTNMTTDPLSAGLGLRPSKDKIKEEIKPVNHVIQKPIEQYVPHPQTDQSHPLVIPNLIIDSNITTPIHDKHIQHKQNIQDIKPQLPKEIKKPKYKDTEGLGAKIPIQNIGALAGTIAGGVLTGGTIAAGEALLTGGLTGLAGAGESIIGTSVGSGIGAGINSALGGGNVGNVVSGIIGGVAGRSVGRTVGSTRTRAREMAAEARARSGENQPLIPRGGDRLGGSRTGQSRLVVPEIQPASDEPGTWVVPAYEPNTIMRSIKKQANRTMQAASDTYDNLRQQLSGRNPNSSQGTYSRLDGEALLKRFDEDMTDTTFLDKFNQGRNTKPATQF